MLKELENDYEDIQKGIPDRHNNDVSHRFILIPLVSVVTATIREVLWGDKFLVSYIICLYLSIVGYVFFDYLLNKLRGKPWYYLGRHSTTDQILADYNPYFLLVVRLILFLPALYLYIYG